MYIIDFADISDINMKYFFEWQFKLAFQCALVQIRILI